MQHGHCCHTHKLHICCCRCACNCGHTHHNRHPDASCIPPIEYGVGCSDDARKQTNFRVAAAAPVHTAIHCSQNRESRHHIHKPVTLLILNKHLRAFYRTTLQSTYMPLCWALLHRHSKRALTVASATGIQVQVQHMMKLSTLATMDLGSRTVHRAHLQQSPVLHALLATPGAPLRRARAMEVYCAASKGTGRNNRGFAAHASVVRRVV